MTILVLLFLAIPKEKPEKPEKAKKPEKPEKLEKPEKREISKGKWLVEGHSCSAYVPLYFCTGEIIVSEQNGPSSDGNGCGFKMW